MGSTATVGGTGAGRTRLARFAGVMESVREPAAPGAAAAPRLVRVVGLLLASALCAGAVALALLPVVSR